MKSKTKLLRLVMLCMLMLFSASEMWATQYTVDVKCEPTGVAKVYAKYETEAEYAENQKEAYLPENSGNFNLKYDNLQEGYTFLGWSKGAPSTNASDMVSTDQEATVTVLSSDATVTYYANFSDGSGSNFTITEDGSISEHGTVTYKVNGTETAPVEGVINVKENDVITLIVTPNTGWVVNKPSGQWYAAIGAAKAPKRVQSNIDMLKDFELNPVEGNPNAFTFVMKRANAEISVSYKKLLTNTDITIEDITALTYSGQAQEPVVTVKDGSVVLTKDVDYTVTYSNNTNAALSTATENAPTVTITAVATSEKYAGETTKTFTILPKALEDGFIANIASLVYTGVAQTPEPAVTYNNMTLVKGTDFTYSYTNNVNVAAATAENAPTVTVTGKGNYTGTAQKKFDITKKALTVTADNKQVTYGDDAPQYTVSYDGFVNNETNAVLGGTLAFACDYVKNQSGAGNYDITPSGLTSSNYDITFTKGTLTVGKKALENGFIANIASLVYNGVAQEPAPVVTFNGMTLEKGTDYSVAYSDNVNVGTATATVTALANSTKYSGSASKTFSINKADITPTAPVAKTGLVYNELAQELITAGSIVGAGNMEACEMQYSLDGQTYATTIPTGTNAKEYTVYYKVVADANHNAVAAQNFKVTITAATLTEATLKDTLFIFNPFGPKAQTAEVDVVKAGELIVPATDYTVSDDTQTDLGDYQLTVTGKNNFQGIVKANFHIVKDDLPVTAEDTESGEEVDNVTIQISVETDTDTGDKTVIVDQLDVTPATSSQQVTVEIPSQINGVPVAGIAGGALVNATNVSDIYMPETGETPIEVTDASLQAGDGKAIIHAPLQLLDNYAKMLPSHVGEKKVVSEVTQTAKRFWSFSCGVDVELPEGVTANIVKANTESQVTSEPIKGNVVKANNGVLLEGYQGVEYTLTAMAATGVGNDYEGNLLEPVIEKKHYGYGQGYYILKDGKFYAIANDAAEIPSCKAVMHIAGASARVISIDFDEPTGITHETYKSYETSELYTIDGRKVNAPTKKGMYIMNGKKVVVK